MVDDLVVLNQNLGLYLKPLAKLLITIILPEKKIVGKMISNWEVMETIKKKINPEVFISLKVCTTSLTKVLLEAEVKSLDERCSIIKKLDGNFIKLSGFQDKFIMTAEPAKIKNIKKSDWEEIFKNKTIYNSNYAGERADTIHITELPTSWFKTTNKSIDDNIKETFSKFGSISRHDIPFLDPYNERINSIMEKGYDVHSEGFKKTSFLAQGLRFDAYIQYSNHSGFCNCIDALKGMKMVRIVSGEEETYYCNFKIDFDSKKRLSLKTIGEREKIREDILERDRCHKQEIENMKSEQQKLEQERVVEQEKLSQEKATLKIIKEQEEFERKQKKIQEKQEKDKRLISQLENDIENLQHRIHLVHECRNFTSIK
ncbi:hypothetical protein HZS_5544, partial [Henneguya salminicola]